MFTVRDCMEAGGRYSRDELAFLTGKPDRTVRRDIRQLRREGVPVMSLPDGGYKLAQTEAEKAEMLHQIKGRALDLLRTHSLMAHNMELDGQVTLNELLDALEVEE